MKGICHEIEKFGRIAWANILQRIRFYAFFVSYIEEKRAKFIADTNRKIHYRSIEELSIEFFFWHKFYQSIFHFVIEFVSEIDRWAKKHPRFV